MERETQPRVKVERGEGGTGDSVKYSLRSLAVIVGCSTVGGLAAWSTGANVWALLGVVTGVFIAGIMERR